MDMDEKEVQINTQIILFDERCDEATKKMAKLAEKIGMNASLLEAVEGMLKENRANGGQWGEALLILEQKLVEEKNSLIKQKEGLFAQKVGYYEMAEKLRNNQQLELNL